MTKVSRNVTQCVKLLNFIESCIVEVVGRLEMYMLTAASPKTRRRITSVICFISLIELFM